MAHDTGGIIKCGLCDSSLKGLRHIPGIAIVLSPEPTLACGPPAGPFLHAVKFKAEGGEPTILQDSPNAAVSVEIRGHRDFRVTQECTAGC